QAEDGIRDRTVTGVQTCALPISYTMLSKRKLLALVQEKLVRGWDDPRMPTISGFRRRGYTPKAIRAFCKHIGMNKFDSAIEINELGRASCRERAEIREVAGTVKR